MADEVGGDAGCGGGRLDGAAFDVTDAGAVEATSVRRFVLVEPGVLAELLYRCPVSIRFVDLPHRNIRFTSTDGGVGIV
ncbi:MAG: hypothetical protein GY720_08735 [bacterium]|nr:hypothetical protein [bacterium]